MMLEDVKRIAIGVVILVFLVVLFYRILGSPECDATANATANELRDAIERVAAERGVKPWEGYGPPPTEDTEYYAGVPIRLCEDKLGVVQVGEEEIAIPDTGAAFAGHNPTYMIFFERFPESDWWYAWDESYPWAGGAGNALLVYGAIRFGPKLARLGGKLVKKVAGAVKYVLPSRWLAAGSRLSRWWGRVKVLLRVKQKTVDKKPSFFRKFWPNKYKGLYDDISDIAAREKISEVQAMGKKGLLQTDNAGKPITREVWEAGGRTEKYVVSKEHRNLFIAIRDGMSDDVRKVFDDSFYIPKKFAWMEKTKQWFWRGMDDASKLRKTSWLNRRVIQPMKEFGGALKDGFNKRFNKRAYLTPKDTRVVSRKFRQWAVENPEEIRDMIIKNWDDFQPSLTKTLKRKVTKETLSDADMYAYLGRYERDFIAVEDMAGFWGKGDGMVTKGYANGRDLIIDDLDRVRNLDDPFTAADFSNKWLSDWDDLPITEQNGFRDKLIRGELDEFGNLRTDLMSTTEAGVIYKDMQASMLESRMIFPDGTTSFSALNSKTRYDNFNNIFFGRHAAHPQTLDEVGTTFFLQTRATNRYLDTLKKMADPLKKIPPRERSRIWRFAFVDTGRFRPDINPLASYGTYSTRQSLEKISEIEGGCAPNSICAVTRDNPTAYLINDTIDYHSVKLWREKPSMTERVPTFIQTWMFYPSVAEHPRFYVVSPCFGFAKIWKQGGTIYATIEKCDVGDSPNYCYADYDYVWGKSDDPNLLVYIAEWGVCTGICTVATFGSGYKACSYGCGLTTITTISGDALAHTDPVEHDEEWGYWNFYKAADVCDWVDIISTMGAAAAAKGAGKVSAKTGSKLGANMAKSFAKEAVYGTKLGKASGRLSGMVPDLCMMIFVYGDTSLAWPKRTAFWDLWSKGSPLTSEDITEAAPTCAWQAPS